MGMRPCFIAVICVAAAGAACADGLPLTGRYVSADGQFVLTVNDANPGNGQVRGVYETHYSPVGAMQMRGIVADFAWVDNEQGQSGQAPFVIKFGGHWRPDGWAYAMRDQWDGAYRTDDTILAEGVRTYVAKDGTVQVGSLGTQVFTLQK